MKRIIFILVALLAILIACESDEDAYNVQGFQEVKKYVDEAIPLTDGMIDQTKGELFDELNATILAVEEVNEKLYQFDEKDPYNDAEMAQWEIELGFEKGEWEIKGKELHENLVALKSSQEQFITAYEQLLSDKELTKENLSAELAKLESARAGLGKQLRK